jgi:hypothetical protein
MQHRCTHARILFTPDYQEHCVALDGKPQCNGCKLVELRPATHTSAKQMIEDERHATKAYDFTSGRMVTTW